MAKIQELQKALDKKQIDTSTLNNDQLNALDKAFKSGELTGYADVRELRMEQGIAAQTLATEKEKQLRPFKTATEGITPTGEGIERADFELIGDVTGSIVPYILDASKISDQMIRSGGAGVYGLKTTTQNMGRWGGLVGKVARAIGKRTPIGKIATLLPRTTATLQRVANFGRAAIQQLKYGLGKGGRMHAAPTQLLQTEAKSQLLGMGGAGVGSSLYGMAEAVTDIGGATQEDLASVSDNEIDKLPPVEREIIHASEAMKNAMIYNGLGFGLMPMLGATFRGVGHLLGLGGKQARIFAEEAYRYGYDANISAAMDQNKNFFSKLMFNMMKTIGVFPLIGGPRKQQRRDLEIFNNNKFLQRLDAMAPLEEAEWLSINALSQMRRNFTDLHNTIGVKYNQVNKMMDKIGPELRVVPTDNIRSVSARYMSQLKAQYPEMFAQTDLIKGTPLTEFDDPLVRFLRTVEQWPGGGAAESHYLTMREYVGLHKILTNVLPSTKIQDPRGMVSAFRAGFKKDMNTLASDGGVANILKRRQVKDQYEALLSTSGKPAADAYVTGLQKDLTNAGDELLQANKFFHDVVMPYAFTPTAKKIAKVDPQIFTNLGLLGISTGRATIDANQLWAKTIKQIMSSDNAKAVTDLKWMLGYKTNKAGKNIFDRFRAIWMENAWNTAFEIKPTRKTTRSIIDMMQEAKDKGILDQRFVDDINNGFTQDAFIKGINPEQGIAAKIGTRRFKDLLAKPGEVAQFDPDVFRKNLGFVGDADEVIAARGKFIELFGGGKEGKEALRHMDSLLDIMKREMEVPISDTAEFLKRRFTLSGFRGVIGGILPGATAVAGGAIAGGIFGSPLAGIAAFVLLARKSGKMLGDPQMLRRTFDLFTNLERLQNSVGQQAAMKRWKLFAAWWNYVDDEFKDAPRVDPNKIAFEEIGRYLLEQPTTLLQPNFDKSGLILEMQNRAFFAEKMLESATPAVIASGSNFLRGSLKALDKNIEIDEADTQAASGGAPQLPKLPDQGNLPVTANAQLPGQGQGAGQNVKETYANLFPQDNLGQAIANRNAQQQV